MTPWLALACMRAGLMYSLPYVVDGIVQPVPAHRCSDEQSQQSNEPDCEFPATLTHQRPGFPATLTHPMQEISCNIDPPFGSQSATIAAPQFWRCRDGVPGGCQSGNTGNYPAVAVGRRALIDDNEKCLLRQLFLPAHCLKEKVTF